MPESSFAAGIRSESSALPREPAVSIVELCT